MGARPRRERKIQRGVVLDEVPEGAVIKATFVLNGEGWFELTDGRIARRPKPRPSWWIENGRVMRATS